MTRRHISPSEVVDDPASAPETQFAFAICHGAYDAWEAGAEYVVDGSDVHHFVRRPLRIEAFAGYGLVGGVGQAIMRVSHDGPMSQWRVVASPNSHMRVIAELPHSCGNLNLPDEEHGVVWGDDIDVPSDEPARWTVAGREISEDAMRAALAAYAVIPRVDVVILTAPLMMAHRGAETSASAEFRRTTMNTTTDMATHQTIMIPTTIDGRPAHQSVAEMLAAIARAAVSLAPHPFVVQYDDGEWIVAVTDPDDPAGCLWTEEAARTSSASRQSVALLPTWARASTHEAQRRCIGDIVYAQQYSDTGSDADAYRRVSWRVTLDAPNNATTWGRQWQSRKSDIVASSADEAAQCLWQHLGCPGSTSLMIVPSRGPALWYDVEAWTIAAGQSYWEPVHEFPALTRADSDAELPSDVDPVVREIHRARTTGARHASRCRAARVALTQYVLDECWLAPSGVVGAPTAFDDVAAWVRHGGGNEPEQLTGWHGGIPRPGGTPYSAEEGAAILAALAAMELHGIGGPGGFDGGATATMSWRAALGKGRRQATDGQAWDAAIGCMIASGPDVPAEWALLALPFVRPHDLEWPMAYALTQAYQLRDDAAASSVWCAVARAVMARAQEPGAPLDGPAVRLGQRYGVVS